LDRITTRHCSPGRKTSAAPGLASQIATANGSGACGDFTCSVARAHFGRAVYRCIRFSFPKKLPPLRVVSAIRDRPRPHRARQFSSRAHRSDLGTPTRQSEVQTQCGSLVRRRLSSVQAPYCERRQRQCLTQRDGKPRWNTTPSARRRPGELLLYLTF
jgi:hypothetical protein